jgi:DNA topoisomerase VI subunit A
VAAADNLVELVPQTQDPKHLIMSTQEPPPRLPPPRNPKFLIEGPPPPQNPNRRTTKAKSGSRRTQAEMQQIRLGILEILNEDPKQTVRQVYYQLVIRSLIAKTESEYNKTASRLLSNMRLEGTIPFEWIIDETRRTRQTVTFNDVADALVDTAQFYRRSALRESPVYIEIWVEKEALAGLLFDDAAGDYDVPVLVGKGFSSWTQIYQTVKAIERAEHANKKSFIYHFGDFDPSGLVIYQSMVKRVKVLCRKYAVTPPTFERVALTPEQIRKFRLPTRPTKTKKNPHAKNWKQDTDSTELDALPANELRRLVRAVIERHISPQSLKALRAAEESEREVLYALAREHGGDPDAESDDAE